MELGRAKQDKDLLNVMFIIVSSNNTDAIFYFIYFEVNLHNCFTMNPVTKTNNIDNIGVKS